MYYKGQVVKKNFQKAFDWYSLAAEQGHIDAQRNLEWMYIMKKGNFSRFSKS